MTLAKLLLQNCNSSALHRTGTQLVVYICMYGDTYVHVCLYVYVCMCLYIYVHVCVLVANRTYIWILVDNVFIPIRLIKAQHSWLRVTKTHKGPNEVSRSLSKKCMFTFSKWGLNPIKMVWTIFDMWSWNAKMDLDKVPIPWVWTFLHICYVILDRWWSMFTFLLLGNMINDMNWIQNTFWQFRQSICLISLPGCMYWSCDFCT